MKFSLKYENDSEGKVAPVGLSQGKPTFEDETEGALEVTTELYLKMHMVAHLLMREYSQNNLIKMNLRRNAMLHLKVYLKFHFKKHKKMQKNSEKKDVFDVAVDVSLDEAIKGTPLNLKFGSLRVLYILYSIEQTELLAFSN